MRKSRIKLTPGEVVKEVREKKCWTQSALSELTGIAVKDEGFAKLAESTKKSRATLIHLTLMRYNASPARL